MTDLVGLMSAPGECIVRWVGGAFHETLVIERADPKIWISAEFLYDLRAAQQAGYHRRLDGRSYAEIDGDILRIHGDNRTVIYRIGEKTPDGSAYVAEWPD